MMKTIELWHDKEKSWFETTEIDPGKIVTIRSLYSLVSTGTERVVTSHRITPEVAERMSIPYMNGSLDKSFTYGYSLVGEVVGESENHGMMVHVMHPHQNVIQVNQKDIYHLPMGLDPKLATLISNMETAVNAVWDAQIELGDRVLIQGYGMIGALIASVLKRYPGLELRVLDTDPVKTQQFTDHGLIPLGEATSEFDVIFNTTSSQEALQDAFRLTRLEGTVVELSWYGNKQVNLSLGADFHYGRKRLICSQVSHVPSRKQPLWNYKSRKDLVVRLLQEINPTYLLGHEINFQETPQFYQKLRAGEIKELSTIINYR